MTKNLEEWRTSFSSSDDDDDEDEDENTNNNINSNNKKKKCKLKKIILIFAATTNDIQPITGSLLSLLRL